MVWVILIIKKADNGWYINYIEQKILKQINKNNLQDSVDVIIFDPKIKFACKYISVIDNYVDILDSFIYEIYSHIIKSTADCIGLKGLNYIDNNSCTFSNISDGSSLILPITKLNPIKFDIIASKLQNINYYINIEHLSNIINSIDNINTEVIFMQDTTNKLPFSIIITAYQTQNYIEECLDSIENQTYFVDNDNFEIIVGVDACQDTFEKLTEIKYKYRNLKIYMMTDNKGTYITTNTLIGLAKYENIIRFDSDDIMTPNLVKELVKDKYNNDIVILGYLDFENGVVGTDLALAGIIYFKKSVMDIAGGYQPWRCAADTELISRVANKVKIKQLKKALFYRRVHENSLTRREDTKHNSEIRNYYTSLIKRNYNDSEIKINAIINDYIDLNKNIEYVNFKDSTKLTIIIPVYKNLNILSNCLNSILTSTYDSFNLLVINDSPQELDITAFGKSFKSVFDDNFKNSEYLFLCNYKNLGFIETINRGINLVEGDVIILNSDTLVHNNWIERMLEYKKKYNVASVTPITNSAAQCSFPIQNKNQSHYRDLTYNMIDNVFSRIPMEMSHVAPTGIGFCMLMTRDAISKIGILDNINFKLGYGEENDWCCRATKNGFVNIIATNVYIAHEHGSSFSNIKNLDKIRYDNVVALKRKHPEFFNDIHIYNKKSLLSTPYHLLIFALDFEYFRQEKKPVKIIFGDKKQENLNYSEVYFKIQDLSFDILYENINKTFSIENLTSILYLLNPSDIEVNNDEYLNISDVYNFVNYFEDKKTKITIEIPYHDNSLSGGISRMEKLVFELPKYSITSGGIKETLKFVNKFKNIFDVSVRFQRITEEIPPQFKKWSLGLPDKTFPECDVCITYSDNPYLLELTKLPQVKKVFIYMLSYGMAIDRERKNILTDNVTVMCSTKKLEKLISAEGVKVHRVGFALDMKDMYIENNVRKKYLAIMYHINDDKRYNIAVNIANDLYERKIIDGVITFGSDVNYNSAKKPNGLIKHYYNANRDEIRTIFNTCQCFLMPSISEGLNLSPIESTLCGCPSIICDGAIDEIFFHEKTCLISEVDNILDMTKNVEKIIVGFDNYTKKFYNNMYNITKNYGWNDVIQKIINLI